MDLDFEATGAACVDHLADLGHRDIALIGEGEGGLPAAYRFRRADPGRVPAARPANAACGGAPPVRGQLRVDRRHAVPDPGGAAEYHRLRGAERGGHPALLSLLRLSGRVVPEDASVVAICPEQVASQSSPRLTGVTIPAPAMGRRAVRLALAHLDGSGSHSTTLIAPVLTVRDVQRRTHPEPPLQKGSCMR